MASMIYDFGDGKPDQCRVIKYLGPVALAVELAIAEAGSTREACEALRVSRNMLNRWRRGVRPRQNNLEALADLAGVPLGWLDPSSPEKAPPTP